MSLGSKTRSWIMPGGLQKLPRKPYHPSRIPRLPAFYDRVHQEDVLSTSDTPQGCKLAMPARLPFSAAAPTWRGTVPDHLAVRTFSSIRFPFPLKTTTRLLVLSRILTSFRTGISAL